MSAPLASFGSIKVKLGVLVAASVIVAVVIVVGRHRRVAAGRLPVTLAIALGVTQLLAVG